MFMLAARNQNILQYY